MTQSCRDMTPEQRAWLRENWPGRRRRVPSLAEAGRVFGYPIPEQAGYCCNAVTLEEAAKMQLEERRDALRMEAESARRTREDEWAAYYEEDEWR